MQLRSSIASLALAAVLGIAAAVAQPIDAAKSLDKYPDWKGKWQRIGPGNFDQDKPPGLGQQAPLNEEYQKVLEQSVAEQAAGGQGNNPMAACTPPGMPRMMIVYGGGMEIVVTPELTYLLFGEPMIQLRRVYTDGRQWPRDFDPAFSGYSIGTWEDEDGDGRYDTLAIETRGLKSPRSYDSSGLPFHKDNATVVKERLYLDKANPKILYDDMTVIDSALTRPWSVKRTYRREPASWMETICGEDEHQVKIGKEQYFLSGDGYLMPTRKDQPPPDLKYFNQTQK
ncbi:MAG: hypothetical protein QOG83_1302 [Alphaproteobacteria bacterium]|nr:hypothetical protein [Alphaproteobacteria bacterium]